MSGFGKTFEFGPFRLEIEERRLLRDTTPISLTGKVFETLHTLVVNHGRLVTKDQLMTAVWPGVIVDESNLTYNISILRKALGEGKIGQRYIETVPRQGYRFVASVIESETAHPSQGAGSGTRGSGWVVEREFEFQALHEALIQANSGVPQVRFICGEAGVGKTTLVNLFRAEAQAAERVLSASGECIEHKGEAEPYMPVLEALGRLSRGTQRDLLRHTLAVNAPTWMAQMPWLAPGESAASARTKGGQTRERMLREIEEAIVELTSSWTLVLVLEDLQWCDYSTVDFLAHMTRIAGRSRLLLVGTYRPWDANSHSHPIHSLVSDLGVRRPDCRIDLRLLSNNAVVEWLARRFGGNIASALGPALYARTEGNPLFMNALVRSWEASGKLRCADGDWRAEGSDPGSEIPETLREFIEQQMAMLAPEHRDILEVGSVARPQFWPGVVAAALDRPLEAVERDCAALSQTGHLIRSTGSTFDDPSGNIGEGFEFHHSLYAEVIYRRVPAGRRVRLHQKIGDFLESEFSVRTEHAAGLARHFREGRDPRRAIFHLLTAARQALRRGAHREAIVYLEDGLDMVRRLPDRDERESAELVLEALRAPALMATRGFANSEAERAFRRTLELAERKGGEQKFPAAFGLAALLELRGEYVQSQRLLESYLQEQERTRQYVIEWRHLLACSTFHQGQFETALDHANKGLSGFSFDSHSELLRDYGGNPGLECHTWAGLSLWFLGFPDQALYHSRRALEMAEKPESAYALANGAAQVAMVHQLRREVDESFACAETTIAAGKEQGLPYRIAIGNAIHGWALVHKGQWKEGIEEVQSAVAACEKVGANLDLPYFLALLAEALAACDLRDDAGHILEEALQRISSRSFFYEAELHRLRGCLQAQRRRWSRDAEQLFKQAVQVARRQKAKSLELRALTSWVMCSNRAAEPTKLLAELYSSFTEGFETTDLREAARALDGMAAANARA